MHAEVRSAGPSSHELSWLPGVVQAVAPPGVVDLAPGYLDPLLLPVDLLRDAYPRALSEFGSAALAYGDNRGAYPLRAVLAERGRGPGDPGRIVVTAGTSHALHLVATTFARPGDVVLVDRTCYDLGRRLFTDCGLRTREVAADAGGMSPAALHDALGQLGSKTAFLYLNPTFHNPTGLVVGTERRCALLAVAREHGTLIVEDDAYAELSLSGADVPPSLAELARYHGVVRLRTFSKTLAPGLRLGWLEAGTAFADQLAEHGLFQSGGSPNHLASLAVLVLLRDGEYDRHLGWLRGQLRLRRDALLAALADSPGWDLVCVRPDGGFFLWLSENGPRTERDLLAAAERAGIRVAAGSRFGTPRQPSVRLAYSFHPPEQLARAGERLATALHPTAS